MKPRNRLNCTSSNPLTFQPVAPQQTEAGQAQTSKLVASPLMQTVAQWWAYRGTEEEIVIVVNSCNFIVLHAYVAPLPATTAGWKGVSCCAKMVCRNSNPEWVLRVTLCECQRICCSIATIDSEGKKGRTSGPSQGRGGGKPGSGGAIVVVACGCALGAAT